MKDNNLKQNKIIDAKPLLAEVSPLISVPVQNKKNFNIIKDSTLHSFVKLNAKVKKYEKETSVGYKKRALSSILFNNKIINYLQTSSNNLSSIFNNKDKKNKILNIKNNNKSFLKFNLNNLKYNYMNINSATKYYLEDILLLLIIFSKNNNKKNFYVKLLKKLINNKNSNSFNNSNKLNKFNNKTVITSINLNNKIPLLLENLKKKVIIAKFKEEKFNLIKEDKINKLLQQQPYIEHNLKIKNYGSLDLYKDTNSMHYKSLPLEDKKLIDTLILIDLNKSNNKILTNSNTNINTNILQKTLMTKRQFLKIINPFNSNIASSNNFIYNFNKKNNYNIFKNEKNIFAILEAAFLSMESLISKPIFSVKPKNVFIYLFFYWKPFIKNNYLNKIIPWNKKNSLKKIRNKIYYSKNSSKFAIIFENKLKNLSIILTKIFKKPVHLHFTRIYYPYNDSNILAGLIGFLSFFIKFRFISKQIVKKVIFRIRKRRLFRLKYRFIPSIVTGINIKLGGRILTPRTKRKIKSRKIQWGSLARSNNNIRGNSRFTNKNRTGAFSISIKNNSIVF